MCILCAPETAGWHCQDSLQGWQPSSRPCAPTLPALAGPLNSRLEGAAAGDSQETVQLLLSALRPPHAFVCRDAPGLGTGSCHLQQLQ